MRRRAVSLFTNCGAGDLGYRRAGFRFDVLAEIDERRLEVAGLNLPEADRVSGDLRSTWPAVVSCYRRRAGTTAPWLLAACPPCQGMSSVRATRGRSDDPDAGSRDGRNLLVVPIARVASALKPRAIVVENVTAFFSRQVRDPETGKGVTAAQLLARLLHEDYAVFPFLTDLVDYGVPQTRRRAFLTFIRRDQAAYADLKRAARAPYPRPTYTTARRRLRLRLMSVFRRFELPNLDAVSEMTSGPTPRLPLHVVPVWKDERYAWASAIPRGSGGSAWQNDRCSTCDQTTLDPKAATCRTCGEPLPRPVLKARNGRWRLIQGFEASSYRRMSPYEAAATITTATGHIGSSRTIHPYQNRVLSPLECALLQTFPRRFKWGRALRTWGHTFVREMIGEAVPPLFTERHGRVLELLFGGGSTDRLLRCDDPRYVRGQSNFELGHSVPTEEILRRQTRAGH